MRKKGNVEQVVKKIKQLLKEEKGSAVIEASIWIPVVFFAVILLLVLALQFMEMGIVQGEMLIISANSIQFVDSEKEIENLENLLKVQKQKIHFIKNMDWKISENGKHINGQFQGSTKITGKRYHIERKITTRKENPIESIRRWKQIEETISK